MKEEDKEIFIQREEQATQGNERKELAAVWLPQRWVNFTQGAAALYTGRHTLT